jgi:hypothetical protein
MKIDRQYPQAPHQPVKSFLQQPITATDLRAFDLPLPNGQLPSILPWNNRAEFCSAIFFNFDVARHTYLRLLLDTLVPPSKSSH